MKAVVVQHEAGCPVGNVGRWLAEAGVEVQLCTPYAGDVVPAAVEADALVVLGGEMGAYDDDEAPWLPGVRRLLADAAGDGLPTLGICLGAQLLAAGCGGRVEVGSRGIEAGVVDVRWRPEAADDPLVGGLTDPFPGPSMHQDAVTVLPPGATWLGETAAYPHQVFRVGERAWGVQFHPEVTLDVFAEWRERVSPEEWERYGVDGAAAVEELRRRKTEVEDAGRLLTGRFVAVMREREAAQPSSSALRSPATSNQVR